MKYKIIEVPNRKVLDSKQYIVEVETSEGILFLKSSFKLVDSPSHASLTSISTYILSYEYSTFDSIEAAKKALEDFMAVNPIYAENKRIVEEGTI